MSEGNNPDASTDVVASPVVAERGVSRGGVAPRMRIFVVHADGTLRLSTFGSEDKERTVPQEWIQPLQGAVSKPEWQEVLPQYGPPVTECPYVRISGNEIHTQVFYRLGVVTVTSFPLWWWWFAPEMAPIVREVMRILDVLENLVEELVKELPTPEELIDFELKWLARRPQD